MTSYISLVDEFLNIRINSTFEGQYTIKFFKKTDVEKQNSIFINCSDKTIWDMKISDKDVFTSIISLYGDKTTDVDDTATVKLKEKIGLFDFLTQIITPMDEYTCIGFISHVGWKDEERLPGSQILNFTFF